MAGQTIKEILLRFNIDVSDWKRALSGLTTLLEQQQEKSSRSQADLRKQIDQQKQALSGVVDIRKAESAEIQRQIQLLQKLSSVASSTAKTHLNIERERAGVAEKHASHQRPSDASAKTSRIVAEARLSAEKNVAAELQRQLQSYRSIETVQKSVRSQIASRLSEERLITAELKKQEQALQRQTQVRPRGVVQSGGVLPGMPVSPVPTPWGTVEAPTRTVARTTAVAPQVAPPQSFAMAQDLRASSAMGELRDTDALLAKRKELRAQTEKDIAERRAAGKTDTAEFNKLLGLQKQNVAAIEAAERARLKESQALRMINDLELKRAMGAKVTKQDHAQIVAELDTEIGKLGSISNKNEQQIKQLIQMIRLRKEEAKLAGGGGGGGGFFGFGTEAGRAGGGGGFLGGIMSGFASRLAGTIGFAVLSAEGIGRTLEMVSSKFKDFVESTGPLLQVQEQFSRLATSQGIAPTKFINDLRDATHGLVDDTNLYRTANVALQSGLGTNRDDIIKLTQATVGLARAQGRSPQEAIGALNTFMTTGYARSLAHVTGLQSQMLTGVRSLGGGFDQTTRLALNFKNALEIISRQYQALGEPALTYTDRLNQLHESIHRLFEEGAIGLQKSTGFKMFLDLLGEIVKKIDTLADTASVWGDKLGAAFAALTEYAKFLWAEVKVVGEIIVSVFSVFGALIGDTSGRFSTLRGILGTVAEAFVLFRVETEGVAQAIRLVGSVAVAVLTGDLEKVVVAFRQYNEAMAQSTAEAANDMAKLERMISGEKTIVYTLEFRVPPAGDTELQEMEAAQRMAKIKEELAVTTSKMTLQVAEDQHKKERQLLEMQYEQGLTSLEDYLSEKRRLEDADLQARLRQIKEEHDAKMAYTRAETAVAELGAKLGIQQTEQEFKDQKKALLDEYSQKVSDLQKGVGGAQAPTTPASMLLKSAEDYGQHTQEFGKHVQEMGDVLAGKKIAAEQHPSVGRSLANVADPLHLRGLFTGNAARTVGSAASSVYLAPWRALMQMVRGGSAAANSAAAAQAGGGWFTTKPPIGAVGPWMPGEEKGTIQTQDKSVALTRMTQERDADLAQLNANRLAKLKIYQAQVNEVLAKIAELDTQKSAEEEKAYAQSLMERLADLNQELEDELSARGRVIDQQERITKNALDLEHQELEFKFKNDQLSAEEYLTARVALIQREYEATVNAENEKFAKVKDKHSALAGYEAALAEAAITQEKQLTEIYLQQWDIRTKAVEESYSTAQGVLEAQLEYQRGSAQFVGDFSTQQMQRDTLQQMLVLRSQELEQQEHELSVVKQIDDKTGSFSKQQADAYVAVSKTRSEMDKLRVEMVQISGLQPLQNLAQSASGVAAMFPYREGTKTAEALSHMAQMLQTFRQVDEQVKLRFMPRAQAGPMSDAARETMFGSREQFAGVTGGIKAAMDGAGQVINGLKGDLASLSTSIHGAIKSINESASFVAYLYENPGALAASRSSLPMLRQAPPGLQGGGTVGETGFAIVHAGEHVIPGQLASGVVALVGAIHKATSALATFASHLMAPKGIQPKAGEPTPGRPGQVQPTTAFPQQLSAMDQLKAPFQHGIRGFVGSAAESLLGIPSSWITGDKTTTSAGLSGPATAKSPGGTSTQSDNFSLLMAAKSGPDMSGVGASSFSPQTMQQLNALGTSAGTASSNLQDAAGKAGTFGDDVEQAGSKTSSFSDKAEGGAAILQKGAALVGGAMKTLSGEGGPAASATAGIATGGEIGSMFGPIGGLVGGAIGGVVGLFTGEAWKETQKMAQNIQAEFQGTLNSISSGTLSLAQGVKNSMATIQTAVAQLSGAKGGRQELNAILPQMEQQLQQLQQQQASVINQFDQNLEVLSSPTAYQATIQSIDQIIQSYKDYVNAGGNVAQANQFLQLSFQQLAQQGFNQLNQDEQDAVNNALNYNNLLLQRQSLIQSTNEQIQNIMSQGVAVRQLPTGVSKAIQIQQLMFNSQNQLAQLDQQISVAGYQLQVQQQIFSLATTRIGLETQLVQLQDAQTNQQSQQIAELQSTVTAFQQGTPTSVQAAMGQLGLGAGYVSVAQEPGLTPIAPVKTGIQSIDIQNQQEYNQALEYYNQLLNQTNNYLGAIGTSTQGTSFAGQSTGNAAPVTGTYGTPPTGVLSLTNLLPGGGQAPAMPSSYIASPASGMSYSQFSQWYTQQKLPSSALAQSWSQYTAQPAVHPVSTSQPAAPIQTLLNNPALIPGSAAAAAVPPAGPLPYTTPVNQMGVTFSGAAMTPEQIAALGFGILPGSYAPTPTISAPAAVSTPPGFSYAGQYGGSPTQSAFTVNGTQVDTVMTAQGQALLTAAVTVGDESNLPKNASTSGVPIQALSSAQAGQVLQQLAPPANAIPYGAPSSMGAGPSTIPIGSGLTWPTTPAELQTITNPTGVSLAQQLKSTDGNIYNTPNTGVLSLNSTLNQPSTSAAASQVQAQTTAQLNAAVQVNQLATSRAGIESQITSMRMQEIQADMQRIAAHQQLLNQMASQTSKGTGTLEDSLQAVYQTRSRQGFGNFNGEVSNTV